jgi:hypothetical protein
MLPKPVRVTFPNGVEQVGIAIDDDVLEVGPIGILMQLYDRIAIDGERREVIGVKQQMRSPQQMNWPETEGWDVSARLRHRPNTSTAADDARNDGRNAGRTGGRIGARAIPRSQLATRPGTAVYLLRFRSS